jgi:hypothetical protein
VLVGELAGQIDAVSTRELNVDEGHIRTLFAYDGQGRVPAVGLAHHDDVVRRLEHLPGTGPKNLVIIDHHHSEGLA